MATKKSVQRQGFKTGEFVVYPAHGVGQITGMEEQEVAGTSLELFVINFEQDKLTLRVPLAKVKSVGMRKLAEDAVVEKDVLGLSAPCGAVGLKSMKPRSTQAT